MFALVGDHPFEDSDARLVTKLFDLAPVLCNIPSFIDFQPGEAQGLVHRSGSPANPLAHSDYL